MLRLLFDTETIALLIELCNTITLRITYTITEDGSLAVLLSINNCLMQHLAKTSTMEDVIAQHKASRIITNKFLSDNESLG